ncbi:helix-turn-helix domain-containing protein [Streptomyces sp. NBC_01255]|uniref:helix-turn-helix domain-containing protein n=1 Tax=Streptomyces sp. NBC_01255 TaxID=2903798 RepID=UPI002E37A55B|nr:helix-turn-helix domain-containing protein [Streptomyces sp. NBC_01255]
MATPTLSVAERRTRARQLADDGHSNRAIARQLGIHHRTVARDLELTPAPPAAPPVPTSGDPSAPRILFNLPPTLVQDLNVIADKQSGDLPAPLVRAIHAAADRHRAAWIHQLRQLAAEQT